MNIGEKIKVARKQLGLSQEALAERVGVSVQAVSKWECEQSCPDIAYLSQIADYLKVSLDFLLRDEMENMEESTSDLVGAKLPNDGIVRVIQCVGNRILSENELEEGKVIPLCFGEDVKDVKVEIWGSAEIQDSLNGDISATGSISCQTINGDISTAGGIFCNQINGDVFAGGSVSCANINGQVHGQIQENSN